MSVRFGIVALFLASLVLASPPADAQTYTCVCTASACGNGGVGGDKGQVQTGAPQNRLREWYALDRAGHSSQTGWTCVIQGQYTCTCDGMCGNDAIGANDGKVVSPVSAEDAINLFGAWRTGERRTGWTCEPGATPKPAPKPVPTPKPVNKPPTTPPPKPAPPAASVNLAGTWYDLDGRKIQMSQSGIDVTATMISTDGRKHWSDGTGRLEGRRLFMNHRRDGQIVDSQTGTLDGTDRIDWTNGTSWMRNKWNALATPPTGTRSSPPPPPRPRARPRLSRIRTRRRSPVKAVATSRPTARLRAPSSPPVCRGNCPSPPACRAKAGAGKTTRSGSRAAVVASSSCATPTRRRRAP